MDILRELPELDCADGERTCNVQGAVDGSEVIRIVGILDESVKAQQHGKAEQALGQYAAAFAGGRIDSLERYAAGEGAEGTIKHGRAVLAGSELLAMDAQGEHRFGFDEGLSLQVMCADQAEVDRCWAALGAGGSPGRCGWLKDRFGVSWQVVPSTIAAWMATTDTVARDRAFAAMTTMTKLDVAALQRAFDGI